MGKGGKGVDQGGKAYELCGAQGSSRVLEILMNVRRADSFEKQFEHEWHTRRTIVLSLINRLEEAEEITDLSEVLKCEGGRLLFIRHDLQVVLYL
ncbi:hypothetical protein IBTHAUMO2_780024 [Nitrosopumilaceae archaeon]|nr:hypothetical protein IBTHAUMO2_780024 [Nitrosopumilaceae archaeon]